MNQNMNLYFVLLLAGCMLICIFTPATASYGELEMVYHDVTIGEENTLLNLDVTVNNIGEEESEYCLLDIFASPSPDTTIDAAFLGWAYIPPMQVGESKDYQIQMSMPSDLTEGEFYPTAMIACYDLTVSYPEQMLMSPGSGISLYAVSDSDESCDGPDYTITDVSVPVTPSTYKDLDDFDVTVTVTNNGNDDTSSSIIPIHAYLGDRELGPLTAVIEPLGAGEVTSEKLVYLIPEYQARGSYPLTFIIDPYQETMLCSLSDDVFETGKEIIIAEDLPDIAVNTPATPGDFPAYKDDAECAICDHLVDF